MSSNIDNSSASAGQEFIVAQKTACCFIIQLVKWFGITCPFTPGARKKSKCLTHGILCPVLSRCSNGGLLFAKGIKLLWQMLKHRNTAIFKDIFLWSILLLHDCLKYQWAIPEASLRSQKTKKQQQQQQNSSTGTIALATGQEQRRCSLRSDKQIPLHPTFLSQE